MTLPTLPGNADLLAGLTFRRGDLKAAAAVRGNILRRFTGPLRPEVSRIRALYTTGSAGHYASIPKAYPPEVVDTWLTLVDGVVSMVRNQDGAVGRLLSLELAVQGAPEGTPFDVQCFSYHGPFQSVGLGGVPVMAPSGWGWGQTYRIITGTPFAVDTSHMFAPPSMPLALAFVPTVPEGVTLPDGIFTFICGGPTTFPELTNG